MGFLKGEEQATSNDAPMAPPLVGGNLTVEQPICIGRFVSKCCIDTAEQTLNREDFDEVRQLVPLGS